MLVEVIVVGNDHDEGVHHKIDDHDHAESHGSDQQHSVNGSVLRLKPSRNEHHLEDGEDQQREGASELAPV